MKDKFVLRGPKEQTKGGSDVNEPPTNKEPEYKEPTNKEQLDLD